MSAEQPIQSASENIHGVGITTYTQVRGIPITLILPDLEAACQRASKLITEDYADVEIIIKDPRTPGLQYRRTLTLREFVNFVRGYDDIPVSARLTPDISREPRH